MDNFTKRPQFYDKIMKLAQKLHEPGNIKERRKTALELEQLMSSYDVRISLAKEATPARRGPDDLSVAGLRCTALSKLWTAVFTAAIGFTLAIVNGESGKKGVKPTPTDIGFPDKLLRAATGPDPVFDAHGLAIAKLDTKTVRTIVKFCLEMLDNDKVLESGGEVQMLEMLARICSRREYLGNVKESRLQSIIAEITDRLTNDEVPDEVRLVACKAFDSFFDTCSQIGCPVYRYLSDCLHIVSVFCKIAVQDNVFNTLSSVARMHMFNAAATMLFAHPDHAIGPTKRCGRHLLRYIRRTYANAPGIQREAFNKFLLAHL